MKRLLSLSPVMLSAALAALSLAAAITGCGASATEDSDPKSYIKTDGDSAATTKLDEAASTASSTAGSDAADGSAAATSKAAAATSKAAAATSKAAAATSKAMDSPDAPMGASGAGGGKPGDGKSGSSKYRVVSEAGPGMTAEVVAALDKAKTPPPPAKMVAPDKARVRLATSKGDITLELNGRAAPLHVKSFLHLAARKYFDGTRFHRYEPGFVIQGGDPLTKNPKLEQFFGQGGPGYQIPREYNDLKHNAMVLAAARSPDPDSAGSQFYITLEPAYSLDKEQARDDFGYTVFGKVTSGSDVVLKLRAGDSLKSVTILK